MLWDIVILFVCAIALLVASRIVYKQVVHISLYLHIPTFLVSLLLVAFSTSIPELFVGVTSALEGTPAFSLGDIFGSNIVNLTFIAGLVILLGRKDIQLSNNVSNRLMLWTFAITSVPVFLLLDGKLSRMDGALLLTLYALYLYFIISSQLHSSDVGHKSAAGLLRPVLLFFAGVALLIASAEIMIHVASAMSERLHIAPFIVGVFALAFSTSLPELVFGLRVAFRRQPELSLADVLGSCAVNATGILGVVALIHPVVPEALTAAIFTGFFGLFVYVVFFFMTSAGTIRASRGAVLLIVYLIFVSFNLVW